MIQVSNEDQQILDVLHQAVAETLEYKRPDCLLATATSATGTSARLRPEG